MKSNTYLLITVGSLLAASMIELYLVGNYPACIVISMGCIATACYFFGEAFRANFDQVRRDLSDAELKVRQEARTQFVLLSILWVMLISLVRIDGIAFAIDPGIAIVAILLLTKESVPMFATYGDK